MSSTGAGLVSLAPSTLVMGRFRVESQLGRGGMGSVYCVVDERTGRRLAMKRLRANKSATLSLISAQFEREYHTLAQLAHPRIIEVFDYGVDNGEPFYTMELLDGEDLYQRGQLAWREACAVLRDVASSLAILHSRRLLHRDVSARNVRLTADGRAKLIDFGAMAQMGPIKHVVGTPPFLPPEALQKQSLDGRSDLYALGALAYWVLTGRYAYPARTLDQLREVWLTPPPAPLQCGIDLPEPLNQLVMELLQLDRAARPATAAEVMERLSGIGGLPLAELPEVSKAYLSTPMLVGRERPLEEVRAALGSSKQRRSCVLIEGEEGTGRSRLLDACVLEAKLLGAIVLRADASDGAGTDLGVARELSVQLLEALPEIAQQGARLWSAQLAGFLPQLAPNAPATATASPDRQRLTTALRNWFLVVARRRFLVITIDDFDGIDEASAAWLSGLTLAARRRRLACVLTCRSAERNNTRLAALRETAKSITLENLDLEQSEALLQSVFGDVDHVSGIAARIHQITQGNPRWTMAFAETLVERKLARYEAGSWTLPAQLTSGDLPESLAGVLAARVESLPADARALVEALSLTDAALLPVDTYPLLISEAAGAGTSAAAALHLLLARGVLVPGGAGHRFAQQELGDRLRQSISEARAKQLHARLAEAALGAGDSLMIARHQLLSDQEQPAIARLLPMRNDTTHSFSTRLLDVLHLAAAAAKRLQLGVLISNEFDEWLVAQAAVLGKLDLFKRHAEALLSRMERDSGLSDYLAASPSLPEADRLSAAVAAAQARYDATPPEQRGLAPKGALRRLGRVCSLVTSMAAISGDLTLIERLPSLVPLFPACPELEVAQAHIRTQLNMLSGRFDLAGAATYELLQLLDRREFALDPLHAGELRKSSLYVLSLLSAASGAVNAEQWLGSLEQIPGLRVLAWRLRMVAAVALGNAETAAECRKRAELLLLEDAGRVPWPGTTGTIELHVYAAADDVVGTKRAMERIAPMTEAFPCWRPHLAVARAQYLRIQGDPRAALEALEPALQWVAPCRHSQWGAAVELHVSLLCKSGQAELAVARGFEYFEAAARGKLASASLALMRALAEALTVAGRPNDALPLIEEHLRLQYKIGARGVMLGRSLETRARVAIAMHDDVALRDYAERCAREYKGSRNVALSAKYDRLVREAEAAGMPLTTSLRHAGDAVGTLFSTQGTAQTGASRLLDHVDTAERVQEGLRLLLEGAGAESGFVFGIAGGKLELRASTETLQPEMSLIQTLETFLSKQLEGEEDHTTFDGASDDLDVHSSWIDRAGRSFEPMLLYAKQDKVTTITGVAVLHYAREQRSVLRHDLLDAIGTALLSAESIAL